VGEGVAKRVVFSGHLADVVSVVFDEAPEDLAPRLDSLSIVHAD
jgi:hypothetical protein